MSKARTFGLIAVLATVTLVSGCEILDTFLFMFCHRKSEQSVAPEQARVGRIQLNARTGGCTSFAAAGGITPVTCEFLAPSVSRSSTVQLKNVPQGTVIGPVYGAIILQMPASVSNVRGTYSGAATGSLPVVSAGGAVFADNANPIVAEASMALWVVEPPPVPGTYTFVIDFDEDGTAPLPFPVKGMFAEKVVANGRAYYPPIFPCTTSFAAVPSVNVPDAAVLTPVSVLPLLAQGGCSNKLYDLGPTVQVVEYYNQALDHYFITWLGNEIALLDAGTTIKGWTRTGQSFKAYVAAQAATTNVCRIYIIPLRGDSHFFGRGQKECDDTMTAHPDFVLEDPAFMAMVLPAAGVCPAGTINVYRVFSNRPDANHRYMTSTAIRAQMAGKGWVVEGDGPDAVVMCAPA